MAFHKWGRFLPWREHDDEIPLESSEGAAYCPSPMPTSPTASSPTNSLDFFSRATWTIPGAQASSTKTDARRRRGRRGPAGLSLRDLSRRSVERPAISRPTGSVAWEAQLSPQVQQTVARNRYPSPSAQRPLRLPSIALQPDLSAELRHVALASPTEYGHNLNNKAEPGPPEILSPRAYVPPRPRRDPESCVFDISPVAVCDRNAQATINELHDSGFVPAPLHVRKLSGESLRDQQFECGAASPCPPSPHSLRHQSNITDFRSQTPDVNALAAVEEASLRNKRRDGNPDVEVDPTFWPDAKRVRLDQALPDPPPSPLGAMEMMQQDKSYQHRDKADSGVGSDFGSHSDKDVPSPVSSLGYEYPRSVRTTIYETIAPAVTHETITENYHEIRQEQITREIHNHHIFHRILPVVDVEVLPARHFVPSAADPETFEEIGADQLPAEMQKRVSAAIDAAVAQYLPPPQPEEEMLSPRRFSAREFRGSEGDLKEYVDEQGVAHSERWWVHAPTIESGARLTGQTVPLYMDVTPQTFPMTPVLEADDDEACVASVPPQISEDGGINALLDDFQEMRIVLDTPPTHPPAPQPRAPSHAASNFFHRDLVGKRRPRYSEVQARRITLAAGVAAPEKGVTRMMRSCSAPGTPPSIKLST